MSILIVGAGGALGALSRFLISLITPLQKTMFPLPTFVANIVGSIFLGYIVYLHELNTLSNSLFLFFGVGFCGAFTTFSTFGLETIHLIEKRKYTLAFTYVIASISCGLLGVILGKLI